MKIELEKLEQNVIEIKSDVLSYLNPPLNSAKHLTNLMETYYKFSIDLESLNSLYLWHNGTNVDKIANLDESYWKSYLSHQFALNSLESIPEIISSENDTVYHFIQNKLFPFGQSFMGEYFALSLVDEKVYYCSTSDYELEPVVSMFSNLDCMFKTINSWYTAKCLVLDENNELSLNYDLYDLWVEIGSELSPDAQYWIIKKES